MRIARRSFLGGSACAALGSVVPGQSASAQSGGTPSWVIPDLMGPARSESALVVYGSMNEQEALPLYKVFEEATGAKAEYVRSSDTGLLSRITVEARAQQRSWDIVVTTAVSKMPQDFLQPFDPPAAKDLEAEARDPNRRWYGVYANYNTPAYNTNQIKPAELPRSYEEFLERKQWAGRVAIDRTDTQWLSAIYTHYGEERGRKLASDIARTLQPLLVDGHLALARAVGSGEYWVALNNYTNLTINVKLSGGPTDFWVLDPVALFYGQVGINVRAPHPKAAMLAANFLVSREGQRLIPRKGRMPARTDVPTNPPNVVSEIRKKKVIVVQHAPEDEKKWQRLFQEIFRR